MKKDTTEKVPVKHLGSKIISIDEGEIRNHLDQMVKKSVEETLNNLLDAEADALCNASRYERSPERVDTRGGYTTPGSSTRKRERSRSRYRS